MQNYIGIKMLQAQAMTRGEYNIHRGWTIPPDENPLDAGYLVIYPDGYQSWSPKDQFEIAYLPVGPNNSITLIEIDAMIAKAEAMRIDPKTALVKVTLVDGFVLYHTSSCVDPDNYSEELGKKIGVNEVKNKLWFAMGFVLQWAKYGLKSVEKTQE